MTVCFKFMNSEPLDNMVTFLNYRFDKVIFFGHDEVVKNERNNTERFLKKYCGVQCVEFVLLPENNLQKTTDAMQKIIIREVEESNDVYFDITGGEGLSLVAFGILSERNDTPMHRFKVRTNECVEFQTHSSRHIKKDIPARRVKLTVEKYIEMRGGVVNYERQKAFKNPDADDFAENVETIWKVFRKHIDSWNQFSEFFRNNFHPNEDLKISEESATIDAALKKAGNKLKDDSEFHHIMNEMIQYGLITDYSRENNRYTFKLKDEFVKDCIWDSGSILEMYMYLLMKNKSDSCKVAVHLDWDGVIHKYYGFDVVNEVDVLSIKGNIPTFVSCKTGVPGKEALYELDTVAKRFGGKYARKVIATTRDMLEVDELRAREMNITIYKV